MKIVHLGYEHSPKDTRIFYKECISLAKEGYTVTYITSTKELGNFNAELNGVNLVTIQTIKGSRIKRYLKYLNDLYTIALKQDGDIYHIHEPLLMLVGLKLKRKNKKVIFDSHEYFEGYWDDLFFLPQIIRKPLSKLIWKWLLRSIKKADGVISATPFIAEQFKKHNIKSIVLNNYPLLDDIQCNNEDFEMRKNLICFAGGIGDLNGIENVLKAFEKVNGNLYLAGSLTKSNQCKYEKMQGWQKTSYLSYLDRDGINDLYNKCTAGIVTDLLTRNNIYSLPIKMFEFMIAGLPVITSNFPLRKEIIAKNQCGICVDPANTDEIAKAIKYIFENKERAKKMGINGRIAVLTKYNWSIEKGKLVEFYNNFRG